MYLERAAAVSGFTTESLAAVVPYLLALHDLGKFSASFQDQCPEIVKRLAGPRAPRSSPFRHDTLGYLLWRSWGSPRAPSAETKLLETLFPIEAASGPLERRDIDDVMQSWMAAVLGHHGKPPVDGVLNAETFPHGSEERTAAIGFCLAVRDVLQPGTLRSTKDVDVMVDTAKRASWWLAGFTILCDWLGSDTRYFEYEPGQMDLAAYRDIARERAARAVATSGLLGGRPRVYGGIDALFPSIASSPSPLQSVASSIDLGEGPQLYVLEDLTGSGKTEAALILAQRIIAAGRADGLFFALPTMATANAMHSRVQPLVSRLFDGPATYLLSHSGPRLTAEDRLAIAGIRPADEYGPTEPATASRTASDWLADSRKKALLAQVGVGTIDQALLAVLQSRHAALRLLGLHRHVLVVDEVHACDAYMHRIVCELLAAHAALGGSAILLSATLPLAQRVELAEAFGRGVNRERMDPPGSMAYPLATASGGDRITEVPVAPRNGSARQVRVGWLESFEAALSVVRSAAADGRCACWVRNSVADAVEAYDTLIQRLGQDHVTLFHARFALIDRLRIEQQITDAFGRHGTLQDRRGRVVIATQVVEQSLDIDFDTMVTDLCPIDLIIQRAGRLQRHPDLHAGRPAACLQVLAPSWSDNPPPAWLGGAFRRTAIVYRDPGVLWRTACELRRRGVLRLPENARDLIEAVYGEDAKTPPGLDSPASTAQGQALAADSVAQNAVIRLPIGYLREGVDWSSEASTPTRLGEPTTTVRLARVDGERLRPWADVRKDVRWPLSQVSVARRVIARCHPDDEHLTRPLDCDQPFTGRDICTIPLRDTGEGFWTGRAVGVRVRGGHTEDVSVRVSYSPSRGLFVTEGA